MSTEADVIEEEPKVENKDTFNLEERLKQQTQPKMPGKTSPASGTAGTQNIKEATNNWDISDDDFDFPEEPKEPKPEAKKKETAEDRKLTKDLFEGSATSFAGFIDTINQWTFPLIHNAKFKKKYEKRFTDLERKQLEDKIAEAEAEDLEDDEKILKKRWDKLYNVMEAKKKAVPMTTKEREDFEKSLVHVMQVRQKVLPPELWAGAQFLNIMSKRIIDVTME